MEKKRIFIVEDEQIVAHDIAGHLKEMGHEVAAILNSGEEAVEKADELNPDLVLMDIKLAGKMDGIEAAEIINSHRHIPIVFLSAFSDRHRIQRASLVYPSGYVMKPFDGNSLKIAVEMSLYISNADKERRRAEKALKESETVLRTTVEASLDAMIVVNAEGRIVLFNGAAREMFQYKEEEVLNLPVEILLREEISRNHQQRLEKFLDNGIGQCGHIGKRAEKPFRRKDGTLFDAEVSMSGGRYNGTRLLVLAVRDVSERRKAENALAVQHETFAQALNGMDALVYVADMQTHEILFINSYGQNIWGDVKGEICWRALQKDQTGPCEFCTNGRLTGINGSPTAGVVWEFQNTVTKRWYHCRDKAIPWPDGRIVRMEVATDITDSKEAEESLRESEGRLKAITETASDAIILIDDRGKITYWNPAAERIFGHHADEALGKDLHRLLVPPGLSIDFEKGLSSFVINGKGPVIDSLMQMTAVKKDGTEFPIEISTAAMRMGERWHALGIVRDITERKKMEEQLLRAHKLESLGVLAGGIAHDFNNLMGIVHGYIELAQMELPSDHPSSRRLAAALRSVAQTRDLTSRLITFSRGGEPIREICADIREHIQDTVHRTIKGTPVRVKFDFGEGLPTVEIDELQIRQCFLNLTANAVEAMPDGGLLTIRAEGMEIEAGSGLPLAEGHYLKIAFSDEGPGISRENLAKIFDPYFTTKGMGLRNGIGLGLAVCQSVLKKHNGHISVERRPNRGVSFTLYLPAHGPHPGPSRGAGRVLIMDDNPDIRGIERAYLEQMGHEVADAKEGQEAIDAYQEAMDSGAPFDLVILNLTVEQGMGGRLAMERLLKIDRSVRAIIASGSSNDPVIENYADYGFRGALTKPFTRKKFDSLVATIIRGE